MMKKSLSLRPRAALLVGAAFLATPALAQETATQPQTAAPPIIVAPPPPIATTSAPAPAPQIQMAPQSPVVQPAPPPGPAPVAETQSEAQPTREAAAERASPAPARTTRTESRSRTTQATSAAPAAVAAPAEPAASPVPQPAEPALSEAPIAAAPPAPSVTEEVQTNESTTLNWSWIAGGALALIAALAAAMLMMRRRRPVEEVADAPVAQQPRYDEPGVATHSRRTLEDADVRTPAARPLHDYGAAIAPAAAAAAADRDARVMESPVAAPLVEAELAAADRTDLAAIAEAPAPVANRPWLEFGLRPIRAGTSEEEALVDVELTVGNAGDTPARDVRISTFMLADAEDSEMERLLTGHGSGSAVPPVTIAPGDGTRVDAHLAVPKGEMGRTFNPVVVAEARYTLPDGREGRTSAAFRVGRSAPAAEGLGAIGASRPHVVEDVEAELIGAPERA